MLTIDRIKTGFDLTRTYRIVTKLLYILEM